MEAGWKGSYVEVLMKPPLRLEVSREASGGAVGNLVKSSPK